MLGTSQYKLTASRRMGTRVPGVHQGRDAVVKTNFGGVANMLETIAVILIILWLLGLVTSYTMGGFIHILLVIAVVVILLRFIRR